MTFPLIRAYAVNFGHLSPPTPPAPVPEESSLQTDPETCQSYDPPTQTETFPETPQ